MKTIRATAALILVFMGTLGPAMAQLPPPSPGGLPGGQPAPVQPKGPVNNQDRSSVLEYGIGMIGVLGILVIVCAPSRKQVGSH